MKAALEDAYQIKDEQLQADYHLTCKNLHRIISNLPQDEPNIHVYREERVPDYYIGVRTYNDQRQLLLTHYCYLRRVPTHINSWLKPIYPIVARYKLAFKIYRALQKYVH